MFVFNRSENILLKNCDVKNSLFHRLQLVNNNTRCYTSRELINHSSLELEYNIKCGTYKDVIQTLYYR